MRKTIGIGIDIGTGNMAIAVCEGGKVTMIESAAGGPQTPTMVYVDADGEWHFGADAMLLSMNDTSDSVFTHMKRRLYESPDAKVYGTN